MKRYVREFATDMELNLIPLLNDKRMTKELFLKTTARIDKVVTACKQGLISNRGAVKEILQIIESVY